MGWDEFAEPLDWRQFIEHLCIFHFPTGLRLSSIPARRKPFLRGYQSSKERRESPCCHFAVTIAA
jgi:hypothetical protein